MYVKMFWSDIARLLLLTTFCCLPLLSASESLWQWKCDPTAKLCKRFPSTPENSTGTHPTVEECRFVCGSSSLWPIPTTPPQLSADLVAFSPAAIIFLNVSQGDVLQFLKETEMYFRNVLPKTGSCSEKTPVIIKVEVATPNTRLAWDTDESYELRISTDALQVSVSVVASTVFGARHGIETLTQLIVSQSECLAMLKSARIQDRPKFAHRGLLLDTARNFLSTAAIKRHIDAMAASKMNVLHWHITDSQSFPLELPSLPNMTKFGAYTSDKIYQPADVNDVLAYARYRGVRVIIEIDAPSHAGNGWQWGPDSGLGNLAVCINQQPYRSFCIQPPCGQLNPANQRLYDVLKQLYADIMKMLPEGEIFHMGGDEVFIPCWNSTPEILAYIGDKPRTTETFLDLWSEYQTKALTAFDQVVGNSNTDIVLWTSSLTDISVIEKYLSKDRFVIQTWVPANNPLPQDLLNLGYRIIVSTKNAWYLDHGFWGGTVYHNWRKVYDNKIARNSKTVGGEVCMWAEYTDDSSVETKTWPRAAAAAERLWSDPDTKSKVAEVRFYRHRQRLIDRGVGAEALAPQWCYQNEGECT